MSSIISTRCLFGPALLFTLIALFLAAPSAHAAGAGEIDREVDRPLADFRKINGADAFLRIAKGVLVDIGVGKAVYSTNIKDPVIGFIFGLKGLISNLTLKGSKFAKPGNKK
jgi:hypothetical protein